MENELSREQIEAVATGLTMHVANLESLTGKTLPSSRESINALRRMALAYLDAKADARELDVSNKTFQQAEAWQAVCAALDKACPGWMINNPKCGRECAVDAIADLRRQLAAERGRVVDGAYIARVIFEVGDEPQDKVRRIAFRGGKYPDGETDLGGLNELALTAVIDRALADPQQSAPAADASRVMVPVDKLDAERWRALLNCRRIRILGHAGFGEDKSVYRHMGLEIWTKHPAETIGNAKELLTEFADIALLTAAAKEPK